MQKESEYDDKHTVTILTNTTIRLHWCFFLKQGFFCCIKQQQSYTSLLRTSKQSSACVVWISIIYMILTVILSQIRVRLFLQHVPF